MKTRVILRPYQESAVIALSKTRRGIIVCPAGSGKTIILSAAIKRVIESRNANTPSIRWIAPTKDICDQALKALNSFSCFDIANIEIGCPTKNWELKNPDLVVVDECHSVPAETWSFLLQDAHKAIWGATATPFRTDGRTDEIFSLIGPIVFQIGQEELRQSGAIVKGVVSFHSIGSKDEGEKWDSLAQLDFESKMKWMRSVDPQEILKRCRWQVARKFGIVEHNERNKKIVEISRNFASLDTPCLLLVSTIDHGENLLSQIDMNGSALVSSKAKGRKKIVTSFRNKEIPLLIATSLADQGFDAPCATHLIMACGGRGEGRTEQRAGRVMRPFDGKTHGIIHDFQDNQHPFLSAQSYARRKTYKKLGYIL